MDLCTILISIAISFFTSLLASYLIWVVLNRMLVPKIELSESIHCVPARIKKESRLFKITITNLSNRDAFDVNLQGRFLLYGLSGGQPDEPYFYVASVGTGSHPYLPQRAKKGEDKKENHRKFKVVPTKQGKTQIAKLLNINEKNVNVSTILHANPKNYLEIVVTCTHSSSSARKITRRIYHYSDIEQYSETSNRDASELTIDNDADSDDSAC